MEKIKKMLVSTNFTYQFDPKPEPIFCMCFPQENV